MPWPWFILSALCGYPRLAQPTAQITFCSLSDGEPVYDPQGRRPHCGCPLQRLGATPPELVTVKSQDGATLHGAIYRPDPEVWARGPTRLS